MSVSLFTLNSMSPLLLCSSSRLTQQGKSCSLVCVLNTSMEYVVRDIIIKENAIHKRIGVVKNRAKRKPVKYPVERPIRITL